MASLTFGNKAPLNTALGNKINPQPLSFNISPTNTSTTQMGTGSTSLLQDFRSLRGFNLNSALGATSSASSTPITQIAPIKSTNTSSETTLTPEQKAVNDSMTKSGNYTFNYGANTTPTKTTQSTTATSTPTPSSSILGQAQKGLLGIAQNGNPTTATAVQDLRDTTAGNYQLGRSAQDIATNAGNRISEIGQAGARGAAGYLTTGTSPVGEGNAAVLNQSTAAQQNAVAQGANMELQGNKQALTAQEQQQSGYNQIGQLGLTGQGQAITATQNAGSLAQPVSQFGILGTPQSVGAFGSNLGAAAFQGGQIAGQQAAGQTAAQMNVANTAAKGIEGSIQQYLQQNPTLNPSDLTFANSIAQWAQGQQLGDPKYQTLANYLNEYISTLAPILGVGGDTTNLKTEIAQSFINARAGGQSISEVLRNISKLADNKLANIVSAGQGGGQVAGGQPQGTTPTSFGTEW